LEGLVLSSLSWAYKSHLFRGFNSFLSGANVCRGAAYSKPGWLAETLLPATPRRDVGLLRDRPTPPAQDLCRDGFALQPPRNWGSGAGQESNSWTCCQSLAPHAQNLTQTLWWPMARGPREPGADDGPTGPTWTPQPTHPAHSPGAVLRLRARWVSALLRPCGCV